MKQESVELLEILDIADGWHDIPEYTHLETGGLIAREYIERRGDRARITEKGRERLKRAVRGENGHPSGGKLKQLLSDEIEPVMPPAPVPVSSTTSTEQPETPAPDPVVPEELPAPEELTDEAHDIANKALGFVNDYRQCVSECDELCPYRQVFDIFAARFPEARDLLLATKLFKRGLDRLDARFDHD